MLSSQQAEQILENLCSLIDGKIPSTKGIATEQRSLEALQIDWWLNPNRVDNPFNTPTRPTSYLRAYLAISGDRIPARGIPLKNNKLMNLDKGIIKSLLLFNIIFLENGFFRLTEEGRNYLNGDDI